MQHCNLPWFTQVHGARLSHPATPQLRVSRTRGLFPRTRIRHHALPRTTATTSIRPLMRVRAENCTARSRAHCTPSPAACPLPQTLPNRQLLPHSRVAGEQLGPAHGDERQAQGEHRGGQQLGGAGVGGQQAWAPGRGRGAGAGAGAGRGMRGRGRDRGRGRAGYEAERGLRGTSWASDQYAPWRKERRTKMQGRTARGGWLWWIEPAVLIAFGTHPARMSLSVRAPMSRMGVGRMSLPKTTVRRISGRSPGTLFSRVKDSMAPNPR